MRRRSAPARSSTWTAAGPPADGERLLSAGRTDLWAGRGGRPPASPRSIASGGASGWRPASDGERCAVGSSRHSSAVVDRHAPTAPVYEGMVAATEEGPILHRSGAPFTPWVAVGGCRSMTVVDRSPETRNRGPAP